MGLSRRDFLAAAGGAILGADALESPRESLALWSSFGTSRRRGEPESIYDTSIGSYLPPRPLQLLQKRSNLIDRVVVMGETHTNPLHHRAELELIDSLHRLQPEREMAVGMEHFYRKHQPYLDDFVRGKISMSKLYELTNWSRTFGYEFDMWVPILQYCRAHDIRIIGLNLPYQVVHAVGEIGLDNLPNKLRVLLPEMDLTDRGHMARFMVNMGLADAGGAAGNHGFSVNSPAFRRYYEAATLWDEFMADSASKWLAATEASNSRMVVLAGSAHVEGRDGIPNRITRRVGLECFTVVPQGVQWEDHSPKITLPPRRELADWVWYTQREIDLV